jgi:hypothetical protein
MEVWSYGVECFVWEAKQVKVVFYACVWAKIKKRIILNKSDKSQNLWTR